MSARTGPTIDMVDVLLSQIGIDRTKSAYWMGRLDDLAAAEVYLASLRDWLAAADDPHAPDLGAVEAEHCLRCGETAQIEALIEASSLGTREAKAARESVPRSTGVAIRIASAHMARAEAAEQQLADVRASITAKRDEWTPGTDEWHEYDGLLGEPS